MFNSFILMHSVNTDLTKNVLKGNNLYLSVYYVVIECFSTTWITLSMKFRSARTKHVSSLKSIKLLIVKLHTKRWVRSGEIRKLALFTWNGSFSLSLSPWVEKCYLLKIQPLLKYVWLLIYWWLLIFIQKKLNKSWKL